MTTNNLVGIQGSPGANHEIAARQMYGNDVDLVNVPTFDELFASLRDQKIGRAVVAYSNTSVEEAFIRAPHKELMTRGADYWLTDKTEVLVRHQLLGLPDSQLDQITAVHSMGVALEQCEDTLHRLLPGAQLIHEEDTALSAELVRQMGNPTHAAVATSLAGELNGLAVISPDIQDDQQNATGFFGWSLREDGLARMTGGEDRTLMLMKVPDAGVAGSLRNALGAFDNQGINISDLHSISIPGSGARRKQFLIEADAGFQSQPMVETLKMLGLVGCTAELLGSWVDPSNRL
ncbi:hypothetical protein EPN95_03675 [Patescibacteria group bacterium]|nr:MAG: hypothetical protein EPN95_03675 [Patescibacteria group bacterium]